MKTIRVLSLLFAVGTVFCQNGLANWDKLALPADDKTLLEINTPQNLRCDIVVETHEINVVEVEYFKEARARSSAMEKRFVELIEIKLDNKAREGNGLRLRVLTPTRAPWEGSDYGVSLELKITVPHNFRINSRSSYGSIKLYGPFGGVKIDNEYGSVAIESVKGETVVKASYSQINLSDLEGAVLVEAVYTKIYVEDIIITEGPAIFKTSYSPVELDNIEGSVKVYTGNGPISASDIDAESGCVILSTSYAPITADNIAGELVCETSYQPIDLTDINFAQGRNKIETKYAPINVEIMNMGDSQLLINNTYSSINLSLASGLSARLMLAVDEGGKIHTRGFSLKPLVIEKNRLVGIVGDGLSRIEVNIDGIGEINIEGR